MRLPLEVRKGWAYLQEFASNPLRISAIARTCDTVLERVCDLLPDNIERMVDVGAGTGDLGRMLLQRGQIARMGKIIAVEPSLRLARLIPEVVKDDRVTVIQKYLSECRAEIAQELGRAEVVTFSVPFSTFSEENQKIFLNDVNGILDPHGVCVGFIYADIAEPLQRRFSHVEVTKVKGQKIPPFSYRVYQAWPSLNGDSAKNGSSNGEKNGEP